MWYEKDDWRWKIIVWYGNHYSEALYSYALTLKILENYDELLINKIFVDNDDIKRFFFFTTDVSQTDWRQSFLKNEVFIENKS